MDWNSVQRQDRRIEKNVGEFLRKLAKPGSSVKIETIFFAYTMFIGFNFC